MPCSGCGSKSRPSAPARPPAMNLNEGMPQQMSSDEMVWVRLMDGNIGDHPIIGIVTKTHYNYRKHGDEFLVNSADANANPRMHIIPNPMLQREETVRQIEEETISELPPPPEIEGAQEETLEIPPPFDFTQIWGINDKRSEAILKMGIRSLEGFLSLGENQLVALLDDVTPPTAKRIVSSAKELSEVELA